MKLEKILQAIDVLQWLGQRAGELPDSKDKGVQMHLQMQMASLYLLEYAKHLHDGMEAYDALLATARGEMELPDSPQLSVFKLLIPRPDAERG